jgi:hypothetical protein
MEIVNEVIEDLKNLADEDKEKLAGKITAKYEKWNDDRNDQIETAKLIMQQVYLNQPNKKYKDDLEWKSDIRLNALYNVKRTRKAMLWKEMWSNAEQMFDVKGTNEQTEENAKIQKASIVDSLNKMEIQRQYDKVADDLFDIGEMIFKTDWEVRKKVVKRQKKDIGFVLQNIVRNIKGAGYEMLGIGTPFQPSPLGTGALSDVTIPYYENARVEAVSPFMFVFDHTKFKLGDKKSWNSLWKIYKRFDTLDNIKANKAYKITPDMLAMLEAAKDTDGEKKEFSELAKLDEYGGQYSVLYCHGDFKINGKIYKNYIAEVLAGKFLIRFEENPLFINPFIYCALEYDPKTKRGISPLKCALNLAKEQERLINVAADLQKLRANPPSFADEQLFDEENTKSDGTVELAPGKIIKVKSDFNGMMPQPVNLSGEGISDLINLSDQKISDLTSVSNFMYGNVTDTKRTATELSLVDKGASAQTSKELDVINQDLTIPMIENVAELLAMFKDGAEYVYTQEKGVNVEYKITNYIRQAQYEYVYEDRNALEDRKAKFEQAYQLMTSAAANPQLFKMFDWKEVYTTAFEMLTFDNPDKFFLDDTPVDQFAEQLKQIPPELQEQAIGELSQYFMGMVQNYQQQQAQAQMQARAQEQVQMANYREQARNQAMAEQMTNEGVI